MNLEKLVFFSNFRKMWFSERFKEKSKSNFIIFFSRHVIETCFVCALMYILLENIIYMSKSQNYNVGIMKH